MPDLSLTIVLSDIRKAQHLAEGVVRAGRTPCCQPLVCVKGYQAGSEGKMSFKVWKKGLNQQQEVKKSNLRNGQCFLTVHSS